MSQALAVTRYTLLEMSRRRVLLVIVGLGVLLTAGLGFAPHVLPNIPTDKDRLIVYLTGLAAVLPDAIILCAFAIGMTVINHDLDSGALVSIFAKPVARSSYTAGKLIAAVGVVLLIGALFTAGSFVVVAVNGGGVYEVVFWTCAALAANDVLLMLLVMALTVYMNNIVAAAIGFAFNFGAGNVLTLHAMVTHNVITDSIAKTLVNIIYWSVPHELTSNLQRQILQLQLDTHELAVRGSDPLARIPGASTNVDIVFWFGYVVAMCLLLFGAVRRKQV